tara:strand:+ start:715 stop:2076 length:1362 start_codon:yes stop_codon:yes gene_type:complete
MKKVYVVHCIDSEGPLHESLEATFERIKHIFHLDLKPSKELLKDLQEGKVDLNGIEESVKMTLDPHLLNYNNTWDKVEEMLQDCLSEEFRNRFKDSNGSGWVYNWHCVDHIDYEMNPRRRDMGYHNIFDEYKRILNENNSSQDGFHFHYHPHPMIKHAHLCATRWLGPTDKLFQVLSRRIIDRNWFPSVNRPGFQVNRPDSHWFLEQFIPFDYATLAMEPSIEDSQQFDFSAGRSGDWRRAPITWEPYHPDHDDYQKIGNCRRIITRCLNIGTRAYLMDENEVRRAFEEAKNEKPVILSFANHDFRDLRVDVAEAHRLLTKVAGDYDDVEFIYCEAVEAIRKSMNIESKNKCEFTLDLKQNSEGVNTLSIKSSVNTFGPQPFFAIKTKTNQYFHDNLDFQVPFREWTYTFDGETMPLDAIEKIGIATNNSYGVTSVTNFEVDNNKIENFFYNL